MKHNPYIIVDMFEEEVAAYTGAPYAVAVDSCTNAIFLCLKYLQAKEVIIPKKTYVSVASSILHSGAKLSFEDDQWEGMYQLKPYPLYDAAKRFTSNMYLPGNMVCLSFHIKKHLNIGKGGMILTDDERAVKWLKRARYEGRTPTSYKENKGDMIGWNMYMTPVEAAQGLMLMQDIPTFNEDLEEDYPDLTQYPVFKKLVEQPV